MNSYSLMEWVLKGFLFEIFIYTNFFLDIFLRIQNKRKEKNFSILWFFSLSVLRFSSTSDSLCPHTSIPPLRIDLEDRTVQIADL